MNHKVLALKEWASALSVLESGQQILLMRKGGIKEETRHFEVKSPSFYLYPSYEHQRRELVKPEFRKLVDESIADGNQEDRMVTIKLFAEVAEDIELSSEEKIRRLQDFHMWMPTFAEERLRWKSRDPLHVLLLRIYVLDKPVTLPVLPAYIGCKSWIELPAEFEVGPMTPVLGTKEFGDKAAAIKRILQV
ncbi:DUF1802 family protein [Paenibacillus tuaregi]|uniref:DUF1802 family protein n=1 Tax=Paenibacillus tuaregi TaxID=1816681 RepID=UPI000837CB5D|nr:DUF1802 family protein [Paenibacillus tuaregi]